jgi:hypothetical protein
MSQPREHLIGLDEPASNASPLLLQAFTHEKHRLESVAEMLALLGVLTMKNVLNWYDAVQVRGAVFQWGEGSSATGQVAAHCLPGQIRFNGAAPHERPCWTADFLEQRGLKALAIDSKLRNVSARTDIVEAIVNKTDNLIEKLSGRRGLKSRFADAAYQVASSVATRRLRNSLELARVVESATHHYRLGATLACEERLDWLAQALKTTAAQTEPTKRQEQAAIINRYLSVLRDTAFMPGFATPAGVSDLCRDVVKV